MAHHHVAPGRSGCSFRPRRAWKPGRKQPKSPVASAPHTPARPDKKALLLTGWRQPRGRWYSCPAALRRSGTDRRPAHHSSPLVPRSPGASDQRVGQLSISISASRSSQAHTIVQIWIQSSLNSRLGSAAVPALACYCSGPSGFFIIVSLASASSFASFFDR